MHEIFTFRTSGSMMKQLSLEECSRPTRPEKVMKLL